MSSTTETARMSLLAPLSGQAVPLEQVPDDVFPGRFWVTASPSPPS